MYLKLYLIEKIPVFLIPRIKGILERKFAQSN